MAIRILAMTVFYETWFGSGLFSWEEGIRPARQVTPAGDSAPCHWNIIPQNKCQWRTNTVFMPPCIYWTNKNNLDCSVFYTECTGLLTSDNFFLVWASCILLPSLLGIFPLCLGYLLICINSLFMEERINAKHLGAIFLLGRKNAISWSFETEDLSAQAIKPG